MAIHHGEGVLTGMNEWSTQQHGASGLTQRCRESMTSMREAEDQVGLRADPALMWALLLQVAQLGCSQFAEAAKAGD